MLYQVIVTILTSKLTIPLRHDPKEAAGLYGLARSMADDAMSINSQEGSMEMFETSELIDVRG